MLGDDLPAARPAEQASAWREGLHPRHRKGTEDGGKFAPKTGGVNKLTTKSGKTVWTAQLTDEQRKANLEARAAKPAKVEGVTRLKIPGGVTTQEIPRQWLVDEGYAVPSSRGRLYGGDGVIQLKRDVDQEAVLVHYLSGKRPENFPVGSKGFDQFMYGRQLPAGASKAEKERLRTLRGKNKGERQAIVRRITAALVASGLDEMEAHALVAAVFDERKHPRHAKGQAKGGQFAPKGTRQIARSVREVRPPVESAERIAARKKAHAEAELMKEAFAEYERRDPLDKALAQAAQARARKAEAAKAELSKPLQRAWEPGSDMGVIEDLHYSTEDDAELGRKLREYYRRRTSQLGETSKRSPGV